MNRLDTSTPLAEVSDFVLELAQPDGAAVRVCVSVGTQPISLAVFLSLLSQQGLIARGGGSPPRSARLASAARQRGLLMDVDDGGEYPSYGYEVSDGTDDPFSGGNPAGKAMPVIDPRPLEDPFADDPDKGPARNFVIEDGEVSYVPPAEQNAVTFETKKRGKA